MRMQRRRRYAVLMSLVVAGMLAGATPATAHAAHQRAREAAAIDRQNLRLAAFEVQAQALASGAQRHAATSHRPAVVLFTAVQATLRRARATDPSGRPTDVR